MPLRRKHPSGARGEGSIFSSSLIRRRGGTHRSREDMVFPPSTTSCTEYVPEALLSFRGASQPAQGLGPVLPDKGIDRVESDRKVKGCQRFFVPAKAQQGDPFCRHCPDIILAGIENVVEAGDGIVVSPHRIEGVPFVCKGEREVRVKGKGTLETRDRFREPADLAQGIPFFVPGR